MKAELIDSMGTDLTVVNAARVSFDKESDWEYVDQKFGTHIPKEYFNQYNPRNEIRLSEKDIKLISYLANHNHWTPFSHVQITMRETVPIFVARQRFKHMVGFTYNEMSRRYVSDEPTFFVPDSWRRASENKKQGSSNEEIKYLLDIEIPESDIKDNYFVHIEQCIDFYNAMIESGVAPEQARMVLPQSMYTSYYVTGSLAAWARAYKLRIDPHAQKEIQDLAVQWNDIIGSIPELKHSWRALTNKED